jgi:hypothetical protein
MQVLKIHQSNFFAGRVINEEQVEQHFGISAEKQTTNDEFTFWTPHTFKHFVKSYITEWTKDFISWGKKQS